MAPLPDGVVPLPSYLEFIEPYEDSPGSPSRADQIRKMCRTFPHPDKASILGYLLANKELARALGGFKDELSETSWVAGEPHLRSDGKFVWTDELIFYVDHYDFELPKAFLDHMKERNWTCANVTLSMLKGS